MSLATQLNRGTLALPMLLLFAALALAGNEQIDAPPAPQAETAALAGKLEPAACASLPRPGLLLAQAPADLPRTGACGRS